ncbi:MAG: GGDEF domain-containing protein [Lachnospiraceae bacterium]|nr:GGDEF domain-containing protein [Lachnospiraceae bacterium]
MNKKIAVCANGWNYDTLYDALLGIREYAQEKDFDIFVFLSYASYSEHLTLVQGELNIYKLMDPRDYDGVIVFSTALNSAETALSLCRTSKEAGIPVVSIGMEYDGIHSVRVSNDEGMKELIEHLIEEHNIRKVFFIGGTPDHIDSRARLDVTRKTLEAHGLKLTDDDIGYGKWTNRYTFMTIDRIIDSGEPLPDAIICANDIMAMAACTELETRGYLCPRDVIVTGFDNCREGKEFYPALSSVEQNYKEIGRKACEIIFDEISGKRETVHTVVPSRFSCGESCGCSGEADYPALHRDYCRHLFRRNTDAKLLEQNERVMRQWMNEATDYNALKETLRDHYLNNHQFEGEGFYICMNKEYFDDVMISEHDLWDKGSDAGIETLIALKNGEIIKGTRVSARQIIPDYVKKEQEQHVYFFMPMHYFENNYGYVILTDFPYLITENMLYPYMEKLQQSIRLMRTNLRLQALSDLDQLTGLYNRFGYEAKALPLYKESVLNRTGMMVMFVDINYMKRINDEHGHIHGDNAIKTVAAAINENIPHGAVPVRYGGDEFLIIVPDCDQEKAEQIKNGIWRTLDEKNSEKSVPYAISVSIGYTVTDPVSRPDTMLSDYIREADRLMYEIKKEMHMKNDRRKQPHP